MPLALITNDDGITSTGIALLARAAEAAGLDVLVAAPSWDSSGASASLTAVEEQGRFLIDERTIEGVRGRCVAVEAAPAFITWAALHEAFGPVPDVVLSGVNHGPNTGRAILHSGTVGAAATATTAGLPGIAFSLATEDPVNWPTVDQVVHAMLAWFVPRMGALDGLVNVNIPDVPPAALRGIGRARLAPIGAVTATVTETGEGYVTLRYSAPDEEQDEGTDVALLAAGHATVSLLRPYGELTDDALAELPALAPAR